MRTASSLRVNIGHTFSGLAFTLLVLLAAGCTEAENAEASADNVASDTPKPNYAQRDGDTYMYIGEVSEDDRKQGKSSPVIAVRYVGGDNSTQRLEVVDDYGTQIFTMECAAPCKVAKQSFRDGTVSRLAITPYSIMDVAFADAFAGLLTRAKTPMAVPASAAPNNSAPVETSSIGPAASDWRGKAGRCRLVVSGNTYIDGNCWVRLERDGSFQIMSLDEKYFAQLLRSDGEAMGHWNETPGSTHAHTTLGNMTRNGACWSNPDAELCAWAA
jgi:hypothetical protein